MRCMSIERAAPIGVCSCLSDRSLVSASASRGDGARSVSRVHVRMRGTSGRGQRDAGKADEAPMGDVDVMWDHQPSVPQATSRWLVWSRGKSGVIVSSANVVEKGTETIVGYPKNGGEQSDVFVRFEAEVTRSFDSRAKEGVLTFYVLDATQTRYVSPSGQEYATHQVATPGYPLNEVRERKGPLYLLLEDTPARTHRVIDVRKVDGDSVLIGEERVPFSDLPSRGAAAIAACIISSMR